MISVLVFIDYFEKADEIIIEANESESEWEDILNQVKKKIKKKYSIYYENRFWSDIERKYDAVKWECCAVLKMLKKCWYYLWEVYFVLKLNVNTVIIQLERTVTDFSKALII